MWNPENAPLNQDENPVLSLSYASFFSRALATLIDAIVLIPISYLSIMNLIEWKNLALFCLGAAVSLLYKPVMEATFGATLGKMAVGVKVVNDRSQKISIEQSFTRNILFIVSSIGAIITSYLLLYTPDLLMSDIIGEEATKRQDMGTIIQSVCSILLFVSVLSIVFDPQKQALHDKFGRSFCVFKARKTR